MQALFVTFQLLTELAQKVNLLELLLLQVEFIVFRFGFDNFIAEKFKYALQGVRTHAKYRVLLFNNQVFKHLYHLLQRRVLLAIFVRLGKSFN